MIVDVGPQLRPYLAVAVADLIKQLARNGRPVPGELTALAAELWPQGTRVTPVRGTVSVAAWTTRNRHAEPDPAVRRRELAAARTRRWRARRRGEDVPLLAPGRPKKRHEVAC